MSMKVKHLSGLKFSATVRNHEIISDQPVPAGEDSGPTPPELFVSSLATCIGVYVADYCKRAGLTYEGLTMDVNWEKATNPGRIGKIEIKINLPEKVSAEREKAILRVADHCTVHNTITIKPEIQITL